MFVDVAEDGHIGLERAELGSYDLAIVDVMLPRLDGWSIVKALRENGSHMPVRFLTARDAVSDRVKGLQLGGDDYLIKPFAFSELLARIRTILRRRPILQEERIRIADLQIDPEQHKAARQGRNLHLTPKEMQLLLLFARSSGPVLARTSISQQLWDVNVHPRTTLRHPPLRNLHP